MPVVAKQQARYIALVVRPIAPDELNYSRTLSNDFLALALVARLDLLVALIAAALRDPVSASEPVADSDRNQPAARAPAFDRRCTRDRCEQNRPNFAARGLRCSDTASKKPSADGV